MAHGEWDYFHINSNICSDWVEFISHYDWKTKKWWYCVGNIGFRWDVVSCCTRSGQKRQDRKIPDGEREGRRVCERESVGGGGNERSGVH